jgi:plasmid maintenance system antidote protein VapI
MNEYTPDVVSSPGDTILDSLEEKGMSPQDLAAQMGQSEQLLGAIFEGRQVITNEIAAQLEQVLGSSVAFWLARDQHYHEYLVRQGELLRARQPDIDRETGVGLIAAERRRHGSEEGWTPEHDDEHTDEQIALAAAYYALPLHLTARLDWLWPWEERWKKKAGKSRTQQLVAAGSLIAAEIDRILRAEEFLAAMNQAVEEEKLLDAEYEEHARARRRVRE